MRNKTKAFMTAILTFSIFSFALVSMAAAGSITVTPTAQAPGSSVSIAGTGLGATKAVAVGFGAESSANDTNIPYSATPDGKTSSGRTSNYPIKPNSFVLTSDTSSGAGIVSTYTDRGDGTCALSYDGTIMGTINYATGVWSRSTTIDVTGIAAIYSATYTKYHCNATPAVGVNTTATGTFSTPITVPATLANGNYNVTAIDTSGNKAVATLTVNNAIPEALPLGTIMLLSMFAVVAASWYFRRRPTIKTNAT